jgi:pimeloyl-[acyl-carrier protein] methyl ester esterase
MNATAVVRDVVLLHGWGSGSRIWDDLAPRLAPRFRVHALPLPGYDAVSARAVSSLQVTVEYVARAAPRRCGVIGWSLGGEVALAWARRMPQQVERLALIATTPCFTGRPGWRCATAPAVLDEFGRALAADRDGTLARFVAVQARGDSRAQQVAGVLQQLYRSGPSDEVLAAGLAVLSDTDLRREIARVMQPALVLHGARDCIVPAAAGRRLAQALPHARFVLLRTCAHAPFLSRPRQVATLLREFFR